MTLATSRAPRDLSTYPTSSTEWQLWRMAVVVGELADLHEEYAMVECDRLRARASGLMTPADTEAARSRYADQASLTPLTEAVEIKGRIQALTEERDYLRILLSATQ